MLYACVCVCRCELTFHAALSNGYVQKQRQQQKSLLVYEQLHYARFVAYFAAPCHLSSLPLSLSMSLTLLFFNRFTHAVVVCCRRRRRCRRHLGTLKLCNQSASMKNQQVCNMRVCVIVCLVVCLLCQSILLSLACHCCDYCPPDSFAFAFSLPLSLSPSPSAAHCAAFRLRASPPSLLLLIGKV